MIGRIFLFVAWDELEVLVLLASFRVQIFAAFLASFNFTSATMHVDSV